MVNEKILNELIESSGKKSSYLADKCGLTRQSFYMKRHNRGSFNAEEIKTLCKELNIVPARIPMIFFA